VASIDDNPVDRRKTALVTGSAGTLGRAFAVALARRGYFVALVDLNEAENRETLGLVEAAGGAGLCRSYDVCSADDWRALHDELRSLRPQLDLFVNSAGVAGAGEFGRYSLDDWQWLLDTNLKSVVVGCHTFVDWLKQNAGGAHIINVASIAGFAALPTMAAYNVSKAGVVALSETLRIELAPARVGITVVCPGFFRSGLLERARMTTQAERDFTEKAMSESRFTADDVAAAALEGVDRNEPYVILPRRARSLWRFKRWFPNAYLGYITKRFRQYKESTNE